MEIIIFSSCQSLLNPIFMSCDVPEMDYFTDPTSLFTFLWVRLQNTKGKVMLWLHILWINSSKKNISFIFLLVLSSTISTLRNALVMIQNVQNSLLH